MPSVVEFGMEANFRARRRLYNLARHVGPTLANHQWLHTRDPSISALACSAGGGEGFQRRDNRTLFARQSSDSHGQFMRQKQDGQHDLQEDSRLNSASALGPAGDSSQYWSSSAGSNTRDAPDWGPGPNFAVVEPLFGKPAPGADLLEKQVNDVHGQNPEPEMPTPCQESKEKMQGRSNSSEARSGHHTPSHVEKVEKVSTAAKDQTRSTCFRFEWFPRMDVVESGTAYVITIELPGVSADGIHVEVVRASLIVTGSRATDWWKVNNNGSNGVGTVYHRRELAQGPYRAMWRLPKNVDINSITAEFIDGFLRVLVPKIKIMTYL